MQIKSLDEVIARLQYKADNIKAKLEPSYFTECIDYLKSLSQCDDGWTFLTDNEDSYPDTFKYVLIRDDIGDKNVACCDPDYDWYISNGEDSLKLIGDIIAWKELT